MANSTGNPICKLCGHSHRIGESHSWGAVRPPSLVAKVLAPTAPKLSASAPTDGVALISARHPKGPKLKHKEIRKKSIKTVAVEIVVDDGATKPKLGDQTPSPKSAKAAKPIIKVSRKVYLKMAARERRKREAAEASKLDITVAEYRVKKSAERKAKK